MTEHLKIDTPGHPDKHPATDDGTQPAAGFDKHPTTVDGIQPTAGFDKHPTPGSSAPQHPAFDAFVDTIAALRAPDGCPWDREQTHRSIAPNMLEEAYEAVDAIESDDITHLQEELGDVLLQVVLQSQIAADAGEFTIDEVCRDINDKIIRRHPHVFGDIKAGDADEVHDIWEEVKRRERAEETSRVTADTAFTEQVDTAKVRGATTPNQPTATTTQPTTTPDQPTATLNQPTTTQRPGLLDTLPTSFPALMQAQKISKKAVSVGFEWETLAEVWDQVYSEIDELKEAYAIAPKDAKGKLLDKTDVELEMGDVLFTLVNVARKMGVDAESSLRAGCAKFRFRWAFIEGAAWQRGVEVEELTVDEMEELWTQAKAYE